MKIYKLCKNMKLRRNKEFQAVYRRGRSYANKYMVLYVVPHAGSRRIGFAAGKRLGCAVLRNRMKRLMREAYRLNQLRLKDDVELILVARKALLAARYKDTEAAFLNLCARAKLFKG